MIVAGPDRYHLNYPNDGPIPLAQFVDDKRNGFIILKFSEGTSYEQGASWARREGQRVRASRLALGGYHMLSGDRSGDGAAEAHYFLSKYQPQPGDLVPFVDYESSGRRAENPNAYKLDAQAFIRAVHDAGFPCGIYGHAEVKASWRDWRDSGADYWWCPGDVVHKDIGPRGPDLWQYGPYTKPAGYPADGDDYSVVLTKLPLIPKETTYMFRTTLGMSKARDFDRPWKAARAVRKALGAHRTDPNYTVHIIVRKGK